MIRFTLFCFLLRRLASRFFRRLCLLAVYLLLALLLLIFWREALSRFGRFFRPKRRRTVPRLSAEQWQNRKTWDKWFALREELSRQQVDQLRDQWRKDTVF